VDRKTIVRWSVQIKTLMQGNVERNVRDAMSQLIEAKQWSVLSHLLVTASEFSARRIIDALVEREVFDPLVAAACLRREVRRSLPTGPSTLGSKRVFRDFEQPDEGEAGVPDHILEEAEAIAKHASQTRRIAAQREAEMDRDPVRHHIVERIDEKLNTSEDAVEAMIAIARASFFEETARSAAMKLGANKMVMGRISRAGRVDDMIAVAEASASAAVRTMIARNLAENMPDTSHPSYRTALQFIAEHHPEAATQRAARRALNG